MSEVWRNRSSVLHVGIQPKILAQNVYLIECSLKCSLEVSRKLRLPIVGWITTLTSISEICISFFVYKNAFCRAWCFHNYRPPSLQISSDSMTNTTDRPLLASESLPSLSLSGWEVLSALREESSDVPRISLNNLEYSQNALCLPSENALPSNKSFASTIYRERSVNTV